jgi:hypothetical protein
VVDQAMIKTGVRVALTGGLGNQLFQYALGRALSKKLGVPLTLDLTWFNRVNGNKNETLRKYALDPFQLNVEKWISSEGVLWETSELIVRRFIKLGIALPEKIIRNTYYERSYRFDPGVLKLMPPVNLVGYWQSPLYFADIEEELRIELSVKQEISKNSLELMDEIKSTDSVCVHVRRGDYVLNKNAANTHGLCGADYYKRGIEFVTSKLRNPHCYVFSDDPEWVREYIKIPLPSTVVDINGPDDAHEDLWLMSSCNHFVIANSSLSWWGAWLSKANNKIIIAPEKWFKCNKLDESDLIPTGWKRL